MMLAYHGDPAIKEKYGIVAQAPPNTNTTPVAGSPHDREVS